MLTCVYLVSAQEPTDLCTCPWGVVTSEVPAVPWNGYPTTTTEEVPSETDPSNPEETPGTGEPGADPCSGPLEEQPWFCNPAGSYPEDEPFNQYNDSLTGFTFAEYGAKYALDDRKVYFRVAVPSLVKDGEAYDVVIQMQAPNDIGWAALAWGGSMIHNPLTVAWANCSNVIISSRYTP